MRARRIKKLKARVRKLMGKKYDYNDCKRYVKPLKREIGVYPRHLGPRTVQQSISVSRATSTATAAYHILQRRSHLGDQLLQFMISFAM